MIIFFDIQQSFATYLTDTMETFGVIPTDEKGDDCDFDLILLNDEGAEADITSDDDETVEIKPQNITGKGDAAAWLARMEGTKTMAKKIAGDHEKKKFWDDYNYYMSRGEHGIRDWSTMATAWNEFVGEREKRHGNDVITYYRKHAHMLENFFESNQKSNNIKATLQPYRINIDTLIQEHRIPVAAPTTAISAPGPAPTHGPNSSTVDNRDHSNMVPIIPLNMSNADVLTKQISGPLVYPSQVHKLSIQTMKKRRLDRAPQVCSTCLHFRQHNDLLNDMHKSGCSVPEHLRNTDDTLNGWCPCLDCANGAKSVGYSKPDLTLKGKRSLKTCNLCGHYKDHGYYKESHLNNTCSLVEPPLRDKFKGYCTCVLCQELAIVKGQEKPLKLRKIYN